MRTLAYSTDMSRHFWAPPTCSAARQTAAWSRVLDRPAQPAPSSPSSSACTSENSSLACLRVWSMVGSAVRVRPSASPATVKNEIPSVPPVPAARAATTIRLAVCPSSTNILVPDSV